MMPRAFAQPPPTPALSTEEKRQSQSWGDCGQPQAGVEVLGAELGWVGLKEELLKALFDITKSCPH